GEVGDGHGVIVVGVASREGAEIVLHGATGDEREAGGDAGERGGALDAHVVDAGWDVAEGEAAAAIGAGVERRAVDELALLVGEGDADAGLAGGRASLE